jgi:hypothetical protein
MGGVRGYQKEPKVLRGGADNFNRESFPCYQHPPIKRTACVLGLRAIISTT